MTKQRWHRVTRLGWHTVTRHGWHGGGQRMGSSPGTARPPGTRSHPHGRHRPQPGGWSPSPQRCQHPGGGGSGPPPPRTSACGAAGAGPGPAVRLGQDKHGAVRNSPLPRLKTHRAGSEPGAGGSAPPAPASGGSGCRSRFPRCLRASPAGQGPGTHGDPTARSDPRCGAGPPCALSPPGVGQPGRRQGSAPRGGTNVRDSTPPALLQPRSPPGGVGQGSVGARALPEPVPVRGPPAAPGHGRHLMAGPGTAGGGHGPQTPFASPRPSPKLRDAPRPGGAQPTQLPAGGLRAPWHTLGCRCPALAWHSGARAHCSVHGWTRVCTLTLTVPVHCWHLLAHLFAHSHPRVLTASHPGSEQCGGRSPNPLCAHERGLCQCHAPSSGPLSPNMGAEPRTPQRTETPAGCTKPHDAAGTGTLPSTGLPANAEVARPQQQGSCSEPRPFNSPPPPPGFFGPKVQRGGAGGGALGLPAG